MDFEKEDVHGVLKTFTKPMDGYALGPMFPIPMCQWDLIGTKKTSKLLKSAGEAFTQTHTHVA